MTRKESDIKRAILQYLKAKGIFAWSVYTGGIYKRSTNRYIPAHLIGVSDIIGILPGGRMLCIEVKRPNNKLSWQQERFLEAINKAGGLAFVAYSIQDCIEAGL